MPTVVVDGDTTITRTITVTGTASDQETPVSVDAITYTYDFNNHPNAFKATVARTPAGGDQAPMSAFYNVGNYGEGLMDYPVNRMTFSTPSGGVGPTGPQEGAGYLYCETSGEPLGARYFVLLPNSYDNTIGVNVKYYYMQRGGVSPSMKWQYLPEGANEDTGWVDIKTLQGPTAARSDPAIWIYDEWDFADFSIPSGFIKLRFIWKTSDTGTAWHNDQAIDNLIVTVEGSNPDPGAFIVGPSWASLANVSFDDEDLVGVPLGANFIKTLDVDHAVAINVGEVRTPILVFDIQESMGLGSGRITDGYKIAVVQVNTNETYTDNNQQINGATTVITLAELHQSLMFREHVSILSLGEDRKVELIKSSLEEPGVLENYTRQWISTMENLESIGVSEAYSRDIDKINHVIMSLATRLQKNAQAVLYDLLVRGEVMSLDALQLIAKEKAPVGYSPFQDFVTGDYKYQKAIVGLSLDTRVTDETKPTITDMVVNVDVEDIRDGGEATGSTMGWVSVSFNQTFVSVPEVQVTLKSGGSAQGFLDTRNITTTGFEFRIGDVSTPASSLDGTISWSALGY